MRPQLSRGLARRWADVPHRPGPDVDFVGVPDKVRDDDTFLDLAIQAKGVEAAMAGAYGRRLVALHERQLSLFAQMRTRWDLLMGVPCS